MLLKVLGYTLIPALAGISGSIIAALNPPGPRLKGTIQHFAAGVVFAAAAIELLPKVMKHSPFVAILGFALGIAGMLTMRWITKKVSRRNENQDASPALIAVTGVDIFIDGIVTGAGFAAGGNTGILLAIALSLEFLFLGLAVASGIKTSRFLSIGIPSGLFLLVVAGGILGKTVLDGVRPDILATVLAFGAVALMYLVTEELLVEAHRYAETPFATSMFFIGFLLYLIIEELL